METELNIPIYLISLKHVLFNNPDGPHAYTPACIDIITTSTITKENVESNKSYIRHESVPPKSTAITIIRYIWMGLPKTLPKQPHLFRTFSLWHRFENHSTRKHYRSPISYRTYSKYGSFKKNCLPMVTHKPWLKRVPIFIAAAKKYKITIYILIQTFSYFR